MFWISLSPYEVQWDTLDDSKQNTFEPLSKLKMMGCEKVVKAYDERMQAAAAGNKNSPAVVESGFFIGTHIMIHDLKI